MGCARISVCLVIRKVLPGLVAKYTALVFAGLTAIWTISGILVNAFPCELPTPWKFTEAHDCYNLVAFVKYVAITNIVVEVILVMIPLFIWNLYFFDSSKLKLIDPTFESWAGVLCQQVAQSLSVITACLPCLHPFIISILAGTNKPEMVNINYGHLPFVRQYSDQKTSSFDPTSSRVSQASTTPFAEKAEEPYCRPLATYGLDRSSARHHPQSITRFPANVAKPVFNLNPPRNVFNRRIEFEVPHSRPSTASSTINQSELPRTLGDFGVLPAVDWDSEIIVAGSSRRNSPIRQPTAEYVFNRQKVISVPEERHLYEDGFKRFIPPLPSPRIPKWPPRAF
ncbi:hypothetical protein EJ02DRAFT_362415 [Clathrospora elynae]|uniref:Rhodopsin domain-containing protein n=1 Tax=Clathrospora elynae TaxID=706981 RepID=A0A6A5S5J8_9PLEO|nr:hypothetical protein EJ02DRAFT_362415 [Clathrospora elynae]